MLNKYFILQNKFTHNEFQATKASRAASLNQVAAQETQHEQSLKYIKQNMLKK